MQEILQAVNAVGFPIFVSVYMLIFMKKTIEKLDITITLLRENIEKRLNKIESILEKK